VLLLAAVELSGWLNWAKTRARIAQPTAVGLAAIGLMILSVPSLVASGVLGVPHILVDHLIEGKRIEFIRMWPPSMAVTDSILQSTPKELGHPRLWSEYAGLAEARAGVFNPSFDYIIHALGPANRRAYVQTFRDTKPTLVQTLLPTFSPYEAWLSQTSGEFYLDLLRNYRAAAATPWSIYWRRMDTTSTASLAIASVNGRGDDSIVVRLPGQAQANAVMLLDLEIRYEARNPLGFLPLIGPLPRYFVDLGGTIATRPATLDPYVPSARFPVIAYQGRDLVLRFRTESLLPGASIRIERVLVSAVPITPNNAPWIENSIAAADRWKPEP
jgi:hypothetical protein